MRLILTRRAHFLYRPLGFLNQPARVLDQLLRFSNQSAALVACSSRLGSPRVIWPFAIFAQSGTNTWPAVSPANGRTVNVLHLRHWPSAATMGIPPQVGNGRH